MTFGAPFTRVFRPPFGPNTGGGGAWWNLFGAIPLANCVAAYQPKGATSLAASYVNLVTPGTYDAAPGTAPTWDVTNGWIFVTASSQYLTTGVVFLNSPLYSGIARFSGLAAGLGWIFGASNADTTGKVGLIPRRTTSSRRYYYGGEKIVAVTTSAAGVACIAAKEGFFNGVSEGAIGAGTPTASALYIGAANYAGTPLEYATVNIQAIAFYNTTLTAAQVAALTIAMNAL